MSVGTAAKRQHPLNALGENKKKKREGERKRERERERENDH